MLGFFGGLVVLFINPQWMMTSLISTVIFLAFVLFALFIAEGIIISAFGTTLGKALFRTGVVNQRGEKLGIGKSITRSLYCGVAGMGAGLPLVSLITLIMGYRMLENEGVTLWDKHTGAYIVHEEMSVLNWIFGVTVFLATFAASIAVNFAEIGSF